MGTVKAVCISSRRGIQKENVGRARFVVGYGIEGDAHGGDWHRQISLLSYEKVAEFNQRGANVEAGAFGENLLVDGFDFRNLPVGTMLRCNDVVLEMTQIGKECHNHCQIYQKMGECIMPVQGVFAQVRQEGIISVGDEMTIAPSLRDPRLTAAVVTLSDKGAKGEREDESGPLAVKMLEDAGYRVVEQLILPDDLEQIQTELIRLSDGRQVNLVITTGGTGFSRRDCAPEATLSVATRNAPGIAEAIRGFSMGITPRAMLSREASVIRNQTLIVNLPGSPKAVGECLGFVLPSLLHGIEILTGLDSECARK